MVTVKDRPYGVVSRVVSRKFIIRLYPDTQTTKPNKDIMHSRGIVGSQLNKHYYHERFSYIF